MVGGHKMAAGVRAGAGWRCDCFGDLGFWRNALVPEHPQWNHMYDCYPQAVCESGAQDAWKTAPVVFETCGVPMTWHEKGFDIGWILRQGLKYHGSVFMPKSTALPEPWMDLLRGFCSDLGYRFVVRQFQYDGRVERGSPFEFGCWIENVGVAPIYRRYAFALRLSQGGRSHVVRTGATTLSVTGSAVIFSPGMVTHPVRSAWTSPFADPKVQRTVSPGATRSACSLRRVTSAVASAGMVNAVLSSEGRIRNSDISNVSCVSRMFFHRKKALTCPGFLSSSRSGHGSGSFVEALANTG
jgi:hypothetical protein